MWQGEAQLYHSRLSALLNLKLLNPRECVDAAVNAYREEQAPLNSAEGFIRQILGWREFIRGIYYQEMPEYAERNELRCPDLDVPTFFWDGGTVGTKPYCASGNYIHKMSNYCGKCTYRYNQSHGENACPFTTLYWDFLDRHRNRLSKNPRMKFQLKNLKRKSPEDMNAIRRQAVTLREKIENGIRM